jgi:hypothetical protein
MKTPQIPEGHKEAGVKLTGILQSFNAPLATLKSQHEFYQRHHDERLAREFEDAITKLTRLREDIKMLCRAERCPSGLEA